MTANGPDTFDLQHVSGRRVTVLGSTGSIGKSTLDVIEHARRTVSEDAFPIVALTAQSNAKLLAEQVRKFHPKFAVIGDESRLAELRDLAGETETELAAGSDAVLNAAMRPAEVTMLGIVGAAGIPPALAAVKRGGIIALANKECVVAAGAVFRKAMHASRATIVPVDSEHNAAFQLLDFSQAHAIDKVVLTASGGPFRSWPKADMASVTPEQAVAHPNWSMGAKISVDSATLMNKGLELIEAHHLFGLAADKLDAIIHPQSIVHCLVYYADGSTLAHVSAPDMRTPIAHALSWPRRMTSPSRRLDLASLTGLTFENVDTDRFPCLALAQASLRTGGLAPTILNAANEIAVHAFLARRIGFLDIARVVDRALSSPNLLDGDIEDLEQVLELDGRTREFANDEVVRLAA
jgi:1-deoxy-D-xylulose-5-phosphate reductoisomerase